MNHDMLTGAVAAVFLGLLLLLACIVGYEAGKGWVAESCDLYGKVQIVDKMYTCEREYER